MYARLLGLQICPKSIQCALVVTKPVGMSSDAPVFALQFDDVHPYSVGIFREKGLTFGEHDDFREIPDRNGSWGEQMTMTQLH